MVISLSIGALRRSVRPSEHLTGDIQPRNDTRACGSDRVGSRIGRDQASDVLRLAVGEVLAKAMP